MPPNDSDLPPVVDRLKVYVDEAVYPYGRMLMCHMMSCDLDALHEMACKIGVARRHFQNKPGRTPHYDICKSKRELALKHGALEADRNHIVLIIEHHRNETVRHAQPKYR